MSLQEYGQGSEAQWSDWVITVGVGPLLHSLSHTHHFLLKTSLLRWDETQT